MDYPKIAELIRKHRKLSKRTIYELAKITQVSHTYISQIENGKRLPSNNVIYRLAYWLSDYDNSNFSKDLISAYAEYKEIDSEMLFDDFIIYSNKLKKQQEKQINKWAEAYTDRKISVTKDTKEVEILDKPYFDLDWLLNQDQYEIFYGNLYDIQDTKDSKNLLESMLYSRLNEEDIYIIREMIEAYISNRYGKYFLKRKRFREEFDKKYQDKKEGD